MRGAWDLVLWLVRVTTGGWYCAVALACCAAPPTEPYLVEHPVGEYMGDFFGDRNPTVLQVHNPLPYAVHVVVACPSSDPLSDGVAYWETDVSAMDVLAVLIQENDRDTRDQTCWVHDWATL